MARIVADDVISDFHYSICGKVYNIYYKTGIYLQPGMITKYDFVRDDISQKDEYGMNDMNLEWDIDIQEGDRVSIAYFGRGGGTFLIYNHRNSREKYYPDSIKDLYWDLKNEWWRLLLYFPIGRRLSSASNKFRQTKTYLGVTQEIKTL